MIIHDEIRRFETSTRRLFFPPSFSKCYNKRTFCGWQAISQILSPFFSFLVPLLDLLDLFLAFHQNVLRICAFSALFPSGSATISEVHGASLDHRRRTADTSHEEQLSLEHYEEAVVQFLDASCLALPVRFQECATPRLERQKPRKDDERVLEYHRHTLAATHLVTISFLRDSSVSRNDGPLCSLFLFLPADTYSRYSSINGKFNEKTEAWSRSDSASWYNWPLISRST